MRDLMEVFLMPGEFFVGNANYKVRTVLGSCVSITLWHPPSKTGGMSHFLLPTRNEPGLISRLDGRYGDQALILMLEELAQAGIKPAQCEGKLFGGGRMFPQHERPGSANIGQRNGEAARKLLQNVGIPIVSESLFGIGHRQIIFDISKGDVWSNQIKPTPQVLDAEKELWPLG